MKKLIHILLLLLPVLPSSAQHADQALALLQRIDTVQEAVYTPPELKEKEVRVSLRMDYTQPVILNPGDLKLIRDSGYVIRSVDLVYTGDATADFMSRLNRKRLLALQEQLPGIFEQAKLRWRIIRQTGFSKQQPAQQMFHGFSIVYARYRKPVGNTVEHFRDDVYRIARKPVDSTIFRVFARNPQWKQELIVVDMTSSMSPYYKELVAWLYLNRPKQGTSFSLFNDGDGKPDGEKKTGNTGGVYTFHTNQLDTIIKRMLHVSRAGDGGDVQENNIEAILKGLKANPGTKEVILIADNLADMRDYVLIPLVPRPVRIVLCGTVSAVLNTEYLNLARATGGSVHTIETDIRDLSQYQESDQFTIRGVKYRIREGKVERKP